VKSITAYIIGLVTIPVLALAAAFLGLFPSKATPKPPGWEVSIAGRALDGSLEHRSSGLKNPINASDPQALAGADELFDKNCSMCHGDRKGSSPLTFYPRAPQFFQEGTDLEPKEAFAAIDDGIRYSAMPAWDNRLSEPDMWKLANFVAHAGGEKGEKGGDSD
jgi:mono/diheme cytochrome c family protein